MKKRNERGEAIVRIFVLLLSGLILYVWGFLVALLTFLHWIVALLSGRRRQGLAEFLEFWNSEVYRYCHYITGVSNERPFPFGPMVRYSKFQN